MPKTSTVRALMDPRKKERVTRILKRMGINHSEAINIFYSLIEENRGFPFDLKLPNQDLPERDTSSINPEVLSHLKDSLKKNRQLGELLAK
ncbi:MAG: type II toxin-antitoxin system antitoxin, RelB/DinJ family [Gammaproteobacteria bacterium]|nr:MAG: type II toxin-antitoxin system antitoxin, RelB/DinJ family [Gammaproteobacteria bacterium]